MRIHELDATGLRRHVELQLAERQPSPDFMEEPDVKRQLHLAHSLDDGSAPINNDNIKFDYGIDGSDTVIPSTVS